MPGLDDLLNAPEAQRLASSKNLGKVINAPETQKIFSMLRRHTGGDLEGAAESAVKGDTSQLVSAIQQLMHDPEGSRLIRQMKEKLK